MAVNYRLRYVGENGRLHGPFGTRAQAHEYAVLMKLNGYEVLHWDDATRLYSHKELDKVRLKGLTKS